MGESEPSTLMTIGPLAVSIVTVRVSPAGRAGGWLVGQFVPVPGDADPPATVEGDGPGPPPTPPMPNGRKIATTATSTTAAPPIRTHHGIDPPLPRVALPARTVVRASS